LEDGQTAVVEFPEQGSKVNCLDAQSFRQGDSWNFGWVVVETRMRMASLLVILTVPVAIET